MPLIPKKYILFPRVYSNAGYMVIYEPLTDLQFNAGSAIGILDP